MSESSRAEATYSEAKRINFQQSLKARQEIATMLPVN
jgi:hypothetical protein